MDCGIWWSYGGLWVVMELWWIVVYGGVMVDYGL